MEKGARAHRQDRVGDRAALHGRLPRETWRACNIERPAVLCRATDHIREQIEFIADLETQGLHVHAPRDGVYFDTSQASPTTASSRAWTSRACEAGARVDLGEKRQADRLRAVEVLAAGREAADGMGQPLGHGLSRAGTSSARRWRRSTWATTSTSTAAARTTFRCTTPTRSRRPRRAWARASRNFWMHGDFLLLNDAQDGQVGGRVPARAVAGRARLRPAGLSLPVPHRRTTARSSTSRGRRSTRRPRRSTGCATASMRCRDGGCARPTPASSSASATSINDDLNVPRALAVAWEVLRGDLAPARQARHAGEVRRGAGPGTRGLGAARRRSAPPEVQALAEARAAAREAKQWAEADRLRAELAAAGWEMDDQPRTATTLKKR